MTANKHTPGPWVSVSVEGGWDGVAEAANRNSTICTLSLNNPDNARLIAAAPELLEALTKLTSFVVTDVAESCNGNKCREPWCAGCFGEEVAEQTVREAREALDAARAAIAKAGGAA